MVLATDAATGKSRCFAIAMFRDAMRGQLLIETIAGKAFMGRPIVANEAVKKGNKPLEPKGGMIPRKLGPGGPRGLGGAQSGGPSRPFGQRSGSGRPSSRPSSRPFNRTPRGDFGGGPSFGGPPRDSMGGGRAPGYQPRLGDRVERAPDPPPPSQRPSFMPRGQSPQQPSASPARPGGFQPTPRLSSRPGFPAVRRADVPPPPPPAPPKKPEE